MFCTRSPACRFNLIHARAFSTSLRCQSTLSVAVRRSNVTSQCKASSSPSRMLSVVLRQSVRSSSTAAPVSEMASGAAPNEALTWNKFLALRRQRRRISLVASVIGSASFMAGGVVFLSNQEYENVIASYFGFDPLMTLGLATLACGGLGWLVGPFFGNAAFNLLHRRIRTQIVAVRSLWLRVGLDASGC
jgi:import inner membrane translocase subunit TIM23